MNETAKGWGGVLFNATDGMANGSGHVVYVTRQYAATVMDVYAPKRGKPTIETSCVIASSGQYTDTTVDVSFVRPLDCGSPFHFAIPPVPGTMVNVSAALSNVVFDKHTGTDRVFVDIAALAFGKAEL